MIRPPKLRLFEGFLRARCTYSCAYHEPEAIARETASHWPLAVTAQR